MLWCTFWRLFIVCNIHPWNQLYNCQLKAQAFDNVKYLKMSRVQDGEGIVLRNYNSPLPLLSLGADTQTDDSYETPLVFLTSISLYGFYVLYNLI